MDKTALFLLFYVSSNLVDVTWSHSRYGYEVRIGTRVTEVVIEGNWPVASINVTFSNGLAEAGAANAVAVPDAPVGGGLAPPDIYVYEPVHVVIHI